MIDYKKLIAGAVAGLLAAVTVDVNAWKSYPDDKPYNWGVAFKRWIAGAVTGALAALGLGQVS